jgi:hypothetical protein
MEEKPVTPRNFLPGMEGMEKSHPEQYLVTNSPPERVKIETSRIHSFYRFWGDDTTMNRMKLSGVLIAAALLAFALIAGCTQPSPSLPGIPPGTTMPDTGGPSLIPGPTDSVPGTQALLIEVSRNTLSFDPLIKVAFRGGAGMNSLNTLDIKVTRSDGSVSTASLAKPRVGDFVDIKGTTGKDRVEVTAQMITGDVYKIYDQALQYRE